MAILYKKVLYFFVPPFQHLISWTHTLLGLKEAFEHLKSALLKLPVLDYPDYNIPSV